MTKFEKQIYDYIKANNGKVTANDITTALNVKAYSEDTSDKEIVITTIQRMIKQGIPIEYNKLGYRVKQ